VKLRILYLLPLFVASTRATTGRSYLSLRPYFETGTTERIAIDSIIYQHTDTRGSLSIVPFGGQSTDSNEIAKYFMPNGQCSIVLAEDNASFERNINANYLGIVSAPVYNKTSSEIQDLEQSMTYASRLNFCPKAETFGCGFIFRYIFENKMWADISTAIVHKRHKLNPCECALSSGGTGPNGFGYSSVLQSMCYNSSPFKYGRIVNFVQTKTGAPQLEIRLGCIQQNEYRSLRPYVGIDIPTGNKPCQTFLFEPTIGNNQHTGIFLGLQGTQTIMKTDETVVCLSGDFVIRYLAPNTQTRSFDLKHRPWSRYMWVWRNDDNLSDPSVATNVDNALARLDYLINYSTLSARVSPNAHLDAAVTFHVNRGNFKVEAGYHAFASQKENLELHSSICKKIGLSAISNYLNNWTTGSPKPATRSFSTPDGRTFGAQPDVIDYIYTPSETITHAPTYIPITTCDLDLESGSIPAQFIHSLFASFGYRWEHNHPVGLFAGISYDISADCNAFNRWLAWLQLSLEF